MIKKLSENEFEIYVMGLDGRESRKGILKNGIFYLDIKEKDYFKAQEGRGQPKKLGLDDEIFRDLKNLGSCVKIERNDSKRNITWIISFEDFKAKGELFRARHFRPHWFVYLEDWSKLQSTLF